ncbi:MAG: efflux transporter outer membrane subunit [Asticcacaulis sp.]|uniref:efflux transporter outer membrane subunit n=1 Tax=Asticcacaulis sp. TaxID=1872648 RepID=UPI0039E41028
MPNSTRAFLTKAASLSALTVAAALLANCASVPASQTIAPRDLPAATQSLTSETDGQWPTQDWWKGFNDPQLNALIDEAFANSPDIQTADARLLKAVAYSDQIAESLKPSLSANASLSYSQSSLNMGYPAAFRDFLPKGYHPLTRATIGANYDLGLWGKAKAARKGAFAQGKAAEVQSVAARQDIAVSVARAYVELDRLYQQRDDVAAVKANSDTRLQLMQARATHNLEPKSSVLTNQDDQARLAAQLVSVEAGIKMQKNLIAALVGAGPDRGLTIERPHLAPAEFTTLPADASLNLLGRRPDVEAARLMVEAQGQNVKYTKADFYPDVKFSADWGIQALDFDGLTRHDSVIGDIGPAISLPLFAQGRLKAQYRGAEADYNDAVATYNKTLVTSLQQVSNAAISTRSTADQITEAKARVDAAQQTYDLVNLRYQRNLSSKLEVIDAQVKLTSAELDLSDLNAQAYNNRISLIAALGGGFQSN